MSVRLLPLRALRFRAGQSILLGLLSIGAIAACAVGPMYERAVEQAAVQSSLQTAPTAERGVRIDAANTQEALSYLPRGKARRLFGAPAQGVESALQFPDWHNAFENPLVGRAVNRTDFCQHVTIVSGRCATGPSDMIMSRTAANALKFSVGDSVPLIARGGSGAYRAGPMTITGLYDVTNPDDDYWFGRTYETDAGLVHIPHGDLPDILQADAVFISVAGVAAFEKAYQSQRGGGPAPFAGAIDLPVATDRITVDDVSTLRAAVADIQRRIATAHVVGDPARGHLSTDIPALLDRADKGRSQTRAIIPTLAAQLAIVVLVLLGLVIAVGVDQRRPELALARLRGRSRGSASRFFIGEIVALVALTFIPGLALAWLVCELLCRTALPGSVHPEWRWPVLAAGLAVSLVTLLIAVVMARRTASLPIQDLLRNVPPRRSTRGIGLFEAMIAVAAIGGVLVVLTGGGKSTLALITPGLVALFAGVVLSRAVLMMARMVGSRAMWRGRLATAVSALHMARTPNFRRVVTLVCVAMALAVSAVDQWSVADTERAARAGVEVGAPVVLIVNTPSANAMLAATTAADPSGRYAMPVVVQTPEGGQTPLMAVGHQSLRSVADWGSDRHAPTTKTVAALGPANPPKPITVHGSDVRLRLNSVTLTPVGASGNPDPNAYIPPDQRAKPISLRLYFRLRDGTLTSTTLALKTSSRPSVSSSFFGGCVHGCDLSRIEIQRAAGDFSHVRIAVAINALEIGTTADGFTSVDLGRLSDWGNVNADKVAAGTADTIEFGEAESGLVLQSDNHGSSALLQHLDVPVALPCLVAGHPDLERVGKNGLAIHGIDNNTVTCVPTGTLPFAPRVGQDAIVVDLTLAIGVSTSALNRSTAMVFLAADDPKRESRLRSALARNGVRVTGRQTAGAAQATLDQAPPAWSIEVAVIAACAAAVVTALMIVIVALISRRARSRDLAALRLVGVSGRTVRRAVLTEQLVAVLVGTVIGTIVGVLGARLALPAVPLFVESTNVPKPVLATAWPQILVTAAVAFVLLLVAAAIAGWILGRRLTPERLREAGT